MEHMRRFYNTSLKTEGDKVELLKGRLSSKIVQTYEEAEIFHDGKWVMFNIDGKDLLNDFALMLSIKRKPKNKKDC